MPKQSIFNLPPILFTICNIASYTQIVDFPLSFKLKITETYWRESVPSKNTIFCDIIF